MIAEDVPVAVNTTIDALTNDPVQYYLTLTPVSPGFHSASIIDRKRHLLRTGMTTINSSKRCCGSP